MISKFEITVLNVEEVLVETDTLEEAATKVAAMVNRRFDRWSKQFSLMGDSKKECANLGIPCYCTAWHGEGK